MRRLALALALLAIVGLVASCGSSDKDKSSDTTSGTKAPVATSSSSRTVSDVQKKLSSKGITCAGKPSKPKPLFGVQGREFVTCTVDGATVQITDYASADDLTRVKTYAVTIACNTAKGKSSTYVASNTWFMSASFTDANSAKVNKKLGAAVGVEPTDITC